MSSNLTLSANRRICNSGLKLVRADVTSKLGLDTVLGGIELEPQLAKLAGLGCLAGGLPVCNVRLLGAIVQEPFRGDTQCTLECPGGLRRFSPTGCVSALKEHAGGNLVVAAPGCRCR